MDNHLILIIGDSNAAGWNMAQTLEHTVPGIPAGCSMWNQWSDLARRNIIVDDPGDQFDPLTALMDFQLTGPGLEVGIANILAPQLGIGSGAEDPKLRFLKYAAPNASLDMNAVSTLASFSPRLHDATGPLIPNAWDKVDRYIDGMLDELAVGTDEIYLSGVFFVVGGATMASNSTEQAAREFGAHHRLILDRLTTRLQIKADQPIPVASVAYHWLDPAAGAGGPYVYRGRMNEALREFIVGHPAASMIDGNAYERQDADSIHFTGDAGWRLGQAMARSLKVVGGPRVLATT